MDALGSAYVTGDTTSTEATFPVTVGPDTTYNGNTDAFVAKVEPAGTGLDYAGYIGGSGTFGVGRDVGHGIDVDDAGSAYVTGGTTSTEATFPVTGGPDTTYNGSFDVFAAKVDPTGAGLVYAGYIGGDEDEEGFGIAVDPTGSASITGYTDLGSADTFPVTVGPDTIHNLGATDAFVAKVDPTGTGLVYAGYIGGGAGDLGFGIAADAGGNAYVTGSTESSEEGPFPFPATVGPDTTFNGPGGHADAFVAKVNAAGTGLLYAGYIGGGVAPGDDEGRGIAVDAAGAAYVAGFTFSTEATFPDGDGFGTVTGPDTTHNGAIDAFVAKVNAAGTGLDYAGYIGGSSNDMGLGVAVDASEIAYVTGWTLSTEATFPVTVGPDTTHNGDEDAFVAKISEEQPPVGADLSLDKTDSPDPVRARQTLTYTLTVTNEGPSGASEVIVEDELPPGVVFLSATPSQGTCSQAGGTVTCALGSVSAEGSATVIIEVRPTSAGTITNSAEVSAAEPDPNPANNSDTETTTVTGSPRCKPQPCPERAATS